MYRIILVLIFAFGISLSLTYGQSTTPFQTWSVVELGYDLGKLDLKTNYQLRHSYEEEALLERHFGELGLSYRIMKGLKVGSIFRIGKDRRKDEFNPFNRIAIYSTYGHEIKRFTLKYRVQWQHQTKTVKEEDRIADKLRLKVGTEYNIRKWKFDPQFAVEYFIANGAYRMELGTGEDVGNLAIGQLELCYSF